MEKVNVLTCLKTKWHYKLFMFIVFIIQAAVIYPSISTIFDDNSQVDHIMLSIIISSMWTIFLYTVNVLQDAIKELHTRINDLNIK
jgi:hypothetical protein